MKAWIVRSKHGHYPVPWPQEGYDAFNGTLSGAKKYKTKKLAQRAVRIRPKKMYGDMVATIIRYIRVRG